MDPVAIVIFIGEVITKLFLAVVILALLAPVIGAIADAAGSGGAFAGCFFVILAGVIVLMFVAMGGTAAHCCMR